MRRRVKIAAFAALCMTELALLLLGWAFAAQLLVTHGPSVLVPFVESKLFAVLSLFVSMVLVMRPLFLRIEVGPRA